MKKQQGIILSTQCQFDSAQRRWIVANTRRFILVFFLMAGVAGFAFQPDGHAASCEAILGKWA
jgi:hypothetical protein